jgi:hypothetical protein
MEAEISTFALSITRAWEHRNTFEDFTALSIFAA